MDSYLIGIGLIGVGILHIIAAHKEWGWYVNNYQVKQLIQSMGYRGMRLFTYVMCSPCIGFGIYIASGGSISS